MMGLKERAFAPLVDASELRTEEVTKWLGEATRLSSGLGSQNESLKTLQSLEK